MQTAGVGAMTDGRPLRRVNPDLTGGDGGSFRPDRIPTGPNPHHN